MSMKRTLLYNTSTGQVTEGDEAQIDTWKAGGHIVWLDLQDEDASSESEFLQQQFGIHPMAIQDAQRDRHPPKFESFGEFYFLLLKGLSPNATDIDFDTIQIAIFVGENFVVTRHSEPSRSVDGLWQSIQDDPSQLEHGSKILTPLLGRQIVNRYLALLFQIESSLDRLESELLGDDPTDDQLTTLATYKTRLRKMSRTFTYHEQIYAFLRTNQETTDNGELEHEFNDTYEQLERVESLARLYYDLASDLIDSSISLASHRLNGIMKILTIITAIFVPLGFLAGLYGMNFDNIPELHYENSYFVLLSVMAVVATGLLTIFRIKRWI